MIDYNALSTFSLQLQLIIIAYTHMNELLGHLIAHRIYRLSQLIRLQFIHADAEGLKGEGTGGGGECWEIVNRNSGSRLISNDSFRSNTQTMYDDLSALIEMGKCVV